MHQPNFFFYLNEEIRNTNLAYHLSTNNLSTAPFVATKGFVQPSRLRCGKSSQFSLKSITSNVAALLHLVVVTDDHIWTFYFCWRNSLTCISNSLFSWHFPIEAAVSTTLSTAEFVTLPPHCISSQMKAVAGMKMSYNLQQAIEMSRKTIIRGFRQDETHSALCSHLYSMIRGNRQHRRAFLISLLSLFDDSSVSKPPLIV